MSSLGREHVDAMVWQTDYDTIRYLLIRAREMMTVLQDASLSFPHGEIYDLREALSRIRIEGLFLDEAELFSLRKTLDYVAQVERFFRTLDQERFPVLSALTTGNTLGHIVTEIDRLLDRYGRLKDSASPELARIRAEITRSQGSVSRALNSILRQAQADGILDKDAAPTMREGRLVLPVPPAYKRKIGGIVHDESATGKTVFIEPQQVVEVNNRIRELEGEERRERMRILLEITAMLRPEVPQILDSETFLGEVDFLRAKALFSIDLGAIVPDFTGEPLLDWHEARHPVLLLTFRRQGKTVVPLTIRLHSDQRILVISGPNAGGKSVCLKTVALLQYMLQCGLPVPMGEASRMGLFTQLMLDIGDEQSIEDDLSTYSSHLRNMKYFVRHADARTLLLIDEFGTGTEPLIGGAIAEAVLTQLNGQGAYGVITTHYTNLKLYASGADTSVINGAMLYDAAKIEPLFKLETGLPGNSFAFELARKMRLPESIVKDAERRAGEEFVGIERNLRKIARNRRALDEKLQKVKNSDKALTGLTEKYQKELEDIKSLRESIIASAMQEAEQIVKGAGKQVEKTIRDIKAAQAEKTQTKEAREELQGFLGALEKRKEKEGRDKENYIDRKLASLQKRGAKKAAAAEKEQKSSPLKVGEKVRIKDNGLVGEVSKISNKAVTVIVGNISSTMSPDRVERISSNEFREASRKEFKPVEQKVDRSLTDRRLNFSPELDIRGERLSDALNIVTRYIDDAVMLNMGSVRIIHGKGSGVLREEIQKYLRSIPGLSVSDEDIRNGGTGVTIVKL